MVTRARPEASPRVALAADDERTAGEVARVAAARGIPVERLRLEAAIDAPVGAIAYAPQTPPSPGSAAALAPLCRIAAENRRPVVMLCAFERVRGRAAEERAAALAFLRAHGAILVEDPDVWFESATLMATFGAPPGPRVAVIAPTGGWLQLQASALAIEEEARGGPRIPVAEQEDPGAASDLVLVDGAVEWAAPPASTEANGTPPRAARALIVPVVARAELIHDGGTALVGLRAALAAAMTCGRHAERLAQGLGPAPSSDAKRLKIDRARVDKALARAGDRLGDHETKLLVSAYGVAVTRQGVAMSPSAAVRYAQQLGWPVEVKPWDAQVAGEREGGPLVGGVRNPPEARRAFASVSSQAGVAIGSPVIVRAAPPPGRDASARLERLSEVGWTLILEVPGATKPLAASAPLRRADADELAAGLEASRAGDAPPDRAALAELLLRASFAAVDCEEDVEALELGRVVVAAKGQGAIVVDARARLRKKRDRARFDPLAT